MRPESLPQFSQPIRGTKHEPALRGIDLVEKSCFYGRLSVVLFSSTQARSALPEAGVRRHLIRMPDIYPSRVQLDRRDGDQIKVRHSGSVDGIIEASYH